jgi:hypothetical protein
MSGGVEAFVKNVFSLKGKLKYLPGRYRSFVLSDVEPLPLFALPVSEGYYVPWKNVNGSLQVTVKVPANVQPKLGSFDSEMEVQAVLQKWSFAENGIEKKGVSFYLLG